MARGDGEAARPKTRQRFKAAIEHGDGQHPSPPSVIWVEGSGAGYGPGLQPVVMVRDRNLLQWS